MDVDNLSIEFVKSLEREDDSLPRTVYLNYAPFGPNNPNDQSYPNRPEYVKAEFRKRDTVAYIKHKTKNLWLYERGGRPIFMPLHCKKYGFYYELPVLCWIEYLREPTFIVYKPVGYGLDRSKYLVYNEEGGKIKLKWVDDLLRATIFNFNPIRRDEYLSQNKYGFKDY